MKTILTSAALIFSTIFLSCKKDDPAPVDPVANAETLLQNRYWKITSLTVEPAYMGITNVLDYWDDCDKDDLHRFNPANQFLLNRGAQLCYPDQQQEQNGTWSFSNSTDSLSFQLIPYGDRYALRLIQINEGHMTGKSAETFDGVVYVLTWGYSKQ